MVESEEELQSLLMKEGSEKGGLKFNIENAKIMASGPITSCQIDGGKSGNSDKLIFLGSKITADGDCSHKFKRHLLLRRKDMTNLDSILKSRDISLLTNVCTVKTIVFTELMYGYESWTVRRLSPEELMFLNYDAGEDS